MRFNPYTRITKSKVADGMGGWTDAGTVENLLYLHLVYHDSDISAIAKAESTVSTEDTVVIQGEKYTVKEIGRADGASIKTLRFEKQNRPAQG